MQKALFFCEIMVSYLCKKREVRKMSEDPKENPKLKMYKNIFQEDEEGNFIHFFIV